MNDIYKKSFQDKLDILEQLIKDGNDQERILEFLRELENPIADESLDIFSREFQENIERRAKA